MITVLLADASRITRIGLRSILNTNPEIQIVGEAENGVEAMKLVEQLQPHIVITDILMPDTPPSEIARWVRTRYPDTAIIVLTSQDHDAYLLEMMELGVAGYFTKTESPGRLVSGINHIFLREKLFTDEQYSRAFKWREVAGKKWDCLTHREKEVFQLIKRGLDNADIAKYLGLSQRTVSHHVTSILEKIGVDSRQLVIVWAYKYWPDG
jgi:NarL family two-component system response regulator LiaR